MRTLALALAAALAAPALASPGLTLNGVPIDGVTGQRIENATVVIDDRGDVHIQADGWVARGAASPALRSAAVSQPGVLSRRYFLVTQHAAPGTQYDLAVFVNSQWIREVKASEPQVVMEITKYMRPGPNKITLAATKHITGQRLSYGKDVQLKVVIGEGNVGGDHVMIDVPLVEAVRTAAETEDRTEEFVVEAH